MEWILFALSFLTAIISATLGMAGGTILLTFMLLLLPAPTVIPLHAINQFVSNARRAWLLQKQIIASFFLYFALGSLLGNILSYYLMKSFGLAHWIPLVIALLILYSVFKPKKMPALQIPAWAYLLVGFLIGLIGLFIGAVGLILGLFLMRDDLDKKQIIATMAAMQTLNHLLKVISFIVLGFAFEQHLWAILALTAGSLLGTGLGVRLLDYLPEKIFRTIFRTILVVAALKILLEKGMAYF